MRGVGWGRGKLGMVVWSVEGWLCRGNWGWWGGVGLFQGVTCYCFYVQTCYPPCLFFSGLGDDD